MSLQAKANISTPDNSNDSIKSYKIQGIDNIEEQKQESKQANVSVSNGSTDTQAYLSQNNITLEKRIFICEDSNKEAIALWKKLMDDYSIEGVSVYSSCGSTNNRIENFVEVANEMDPQYSPAVFRQIDRDGLIDKQIRSLASSQSKKYTLPLPVNELENFAVLIDKNIFNKSFWDTHTKDLEDQFLCTAEDSCKKYSSKFYKHGEPRKQRLFQDYDVKRKKTIITNTHIRTVINMKNRALKFPGKLLPGKDICKKIPEYSAIDTITNCEVKKHPKSLSKYMQSVKLFFESN